MSLVNPGSSTIQQLLWHWYVIYVNQAKPVFIHSYSGNTDQPLNQHLWWGSLFPSIVSSMLHFWSLTQIKICWTHGCIWGKQVIVKLLEKKTYHSGLLGLYLLVSVLSLITVRWSIPFPSSVCWASGASVVEGGACWSELVGWEVTAVWAASPFCCVVVGWSGCWGSSILPGWWMALGLVVIGRPKLTVEEIWRQGLFWKELQRCRQLCYCYESH